MKEQYRKVLSLSTQIHKYPLACTGLICLFCACISQRYQVSRTAMMGVDGGVELFTAVPGMVLSALLLAVFVGIVRGAEQSKAKRAIYISGGVSALFLCWRGLICASNTVFTLCMGAITLGFIVLCAYLWIKQSYVATALAAATVLALGLTMGFSVVFFTVAALIMGALIMCDTETLWNKRIISACALAVSFIMVPVLYSAADTKAGGVFAAGLLICLGGYLISSMGGKSKIPPAVMLMFGFGLVMRLGYVLDIALPTNQHDVFSVFNTSYQRHNTYIMHIYQNWSLPTENIFREGSLSQYYHPPLYHFLAAVWMKAQTLCGIPLYAAYENVQYFTMFCSAAMMTVGYKLFCEFKLKGVALYTATAILAFHPTFYILAGSVNNDPLTTLLLFMAVLYTVRWYKNQSVKNTLLLAVSIGGAMLTKLSGAMVAVGTAYVMLAVLFDGNTGGFINNLKRLWQRFLLFAAVCFPLGLWWPIRCAVKFGMPIGYVPTLGINSSQYLGEYSIWERLTGIGSWSLTNVLPSSGYVTANGAVTDAGAGFFDYGIAPYVVKSALFGEFFSKADITATQNILAYVMVISSLVLIAVSFAAVVAFLRKGLGGRENTVPLRFMLVYYAAMVGSYVLFCFKYPHTCTMNFRYIVPVLLISAVFIGLYINSEDGKQGRLGKAVFAVATVFAISSALFFALNY